MAQNASFTINDGTNDHVFAASGLDGNVATYQNKAEDYIPGRETAKLVRRHGKTVREVSVNVRMPKVVTETLNGVDVKTVQSFGQGTLKMIVPPDWTPAETAVLRTVIGGAHTVAAFQAAVDEDEWLW